jgi:hypothetical protein
VARGTEEPEPTPEEAAAVERQKLAELGRKLKKHQYRDATRGELMRMLQTMIVVTAVLLSTGMAAAEEPETEERIRPNHLDVFAGGTLGGDERGDGREAATATVGIGYERRLSRLVSIGFLSELSSGERRDHVGIVPITFRPMDRAQFVLGLGWERATVVGEEQDEIQGLVRFGFGYELEVLPRQTVTPEIAMDVVDGEKLFVFGVTIGWDL